jgi:hypothetical protein
MATACVVYQPGSSLVVSLRQCPVLFPDNCMRQIQRDIFHLTGVAMKASLAVLIF